MARGEDTKRVTVTVTTETFERLKYWADKKGISINQYLNEALDQKIAYENKDYPLPTLEQARLNMLVDIITKLDVDINSLVSIITSGFDSLLGLTRGDNYLTEHQDGDL